jgi:hypothetical protein
VGGAESAGVVGASFEGNAMVAVLNTEGFSELCCCCEMAVLIASELGRALAGFMKEYASPFGVSLSPKSKRILKSTTTQDRRTCKARVHFRVRNIDKVEE